MQGDYSRNSFSPKNHFARVLKQQGRVDLDADFNEQTSILLHYLQMLAEDVIGPFGGPCGKYLGFRIATFPSLTEAERSNLKGSKLLPPEDGSDFIITRGRYYVNGLLCENEEHLLYTLQPDLPGATRLETRKSYLVYLDVWERHLNSIEWPSIREVALGGPDTATRSQIVWQVKTTNALPDNNALSPRADQGILDKFWDQWAASWQPQNRGRLKAKAKETFDPAKDSDPCVLPPQSRYRGLENQLYRIEIHQGGPADKATFKWSRDNASVVTRIINTMGKMVVVERLGRDERSSFETGHWVEIVDDVATRTTQGQTGTGDVRPLFQIEHVDPQSQTVFLDVPDGMEIPQYNENSSLHPFLRRWDHEGDPEKPELGGALAVEESPAGQDEWLTIEDGIQISFQPAANGHIYRTGDYWLIPARTITGDIEWPPDTALPPRGVEHYYAPLAIIGADGKTIGLRHTFMPLQSPAADADCPEPAITAPLPLAVARPTRATPAAGRKRPSRKSDK
jgi:hypothetical protein